jgi:hypothetical protein
MCAIALYGILSFFIDLSTYELFWIAAIGLTWAFHLTFTIVTLLQHQPDIAEHGRLFSYAVIFLFNIVGIGIWIVAVTPLRLVDFSENLLAETSRAYIKSSQAAASCIHNIMTWANL